ncbi:hypothetical protein SK128_006246 [Halocaridina rubra]|uniref:Uncharacterized protein n=1 Tax=Halocaridina rubra TaxID=373956 RepID=A0AAN8XBP6_HALRR
MPTFQTLCFPHTPLGNTVTGTWGEKPCQNIRHDGVQAYLQEWSIKPASDEREGYLSEQLSVGVSYKASGEEHHVHLLAKLLPQDPFNRAFVIETLFDLREIKFYTVTMIQT